MQFVRIGLRSNYSNYGLPHLARTQSFASFRKPAVRIYSVKAEPPRPPWSRKWLWTPIAAVGLAFVLITPKEQSNFPSIFSSPTLIPSSPRAPKDDSQQLTLMSPDEDERGPLSRLFYILRVRLYEPLLTARRFVYLFILFVPVILASPMLCIGISDPRLGGDRWGAVWWYEFLVSRMQSAGPTFIKLAQWAASRKDLFPSLFCDRLGSLHSNGKPHSFWHTKRVIERVFHRKFDEVFEQFEHDPIGIGAIAQVYRATLRNDLLPPSYFNPKRSKPHKIPNAPSVLPEPAPSVPTAAVAIKILHPHVRKTIERDLSIMTFFARCLSILPGMQWLSLPEEVEMFGKMMREQLDLRNEADNLSIFEHNFRTRLSIVTFPRPLKLWSSQDVLVEEFQDALPLKAFLENGGGPFDKLIAELGLDAFLNMLLLDNFVHSDLHPGNIMIKFCKTTSSDIYKSILSSLLHTKPPEDPAHTTKFDSVVDHLRQFQDFPDQWRKELDELHAEGYTPEVVFLDAGLVTVLNDQNRRNFLDLFRSIAEFDGYRAGKLMVERCRSPGLAIDTEVFALKMQHLVLNVKRKTFSLDQIKISDVLRDVLKNVREHHVKMEADFVNTVISVLLLEGIGRQLDPRMDLFKSALPILRQLGKQMAADDSMADLPTSNLGALLKMWVWLEARELASTAFVNADDLMRYDWLTPNI